MSVITLDFETYYDSKIKLGFKHQTTEEYIRDKRFEVIGVGVKVDDNHAEWFSGSHEEIKSYLSKFAWADSALLCHNTAFDGAILAWRFGIVPHIYLDTLCMARAVHGVEAGGSLASLALRYGIGEKGTEVVQAEGAMRKDFTPDGLAQYGEYCKNDVDLTHKLFNILSPQFPVTELKLIDITIRMFTCPVLELDDVMLTERLEELQAEKLSLLGSLKETLGVETEEEVRKKLASNKQFAQVLTDLGVQPPMKTSKTTGKETFALAKNDEGFIALTEHEDLVVQELCAVRLGTKSTIEESRIERFLDVGKRNKGRLPIPLKYYGAHTGRWAGSDKVNFQNLPSRDKKKKALKNAVIAPDGHYVINCDSSQIEARVLAWLAGQKDVVEQFARGDDVYSVFASKIYDREISKKDPVERFVGKTCIAEGTLVLCDTGWKPIETVTTKDKLWDGEEWVCHQGLVNNGIKKTLNLCGVWLTPDHLVWSGTEWLEAQSVAQDVSILYQALDTAVVSLPSQDILRGQEKASKQLLFNASVGDLNTQSTITTLKTLNLRDVIYVLKNQALKLGKCIGGTAIFLKITNIGKDCSTAYQAVSHAVIQSLVKHTRIMGVEGLQFTNLGERTGENSYATLYHSMDGMSPQETLTVSTTIRDMNPTIYDFQPAQKTQETKEESESLKTVYDILNCGSRNRFTVKTDDDALIVHNCILGLGYGTGALKLQHTLKTQPPCAIVTESEAKEYVRIYREENDKIIKLWQDSDKALGHIAEGKEDGIWLGKHKCLWVTKEGIQLPNDLYIRYPDLKWDTTEAKGRYVYKSRKGDVDIWGGSVVENVVQALARIIVGEQMIAVNEKYPVVLTVHDAAVCVVREEEITEAMDYITKVMSTPPEWAKGLPVACEANYARNYGEC